MIAGLMEVEPGRVLAGKYRVERVLGRGGMGVVVAAVQEPIGRRVAVKLLHGEALRDARAKARFMREARAASALSGPHVVRVFDFGTLDDGSPYLAMELCEGIDLATEVKKNGPMSAERAAGIALQACEALAEAHAHGVVHRDVKPANLFLAREARGEVLKVLDFGIAKANPFGDEAHPLTRSDAMVGTPQYMAPEQILSASDADARSDVWSLGAVMHELVTGKPPFEAETVGKIVARVLQEKPPKMPASVPPKFAAVVARCLDRDRDARFRDVGALARALEEHAPASMRGRAEEVAEILRSTPAPATEATGDVAPATRTDWGTTTRPRSRRAFGVVAAIFVIGAGTLIVRMRAGSTGALEEPRGASMAIDSTSASVSATASVSASVTVPESTSASATIAAKPIAKPTIPPKLATSPSPEVPAPPPTTTPEPSPTASTKPSSDPNLEGL